MSIQLIDNGENASSIRDKLNQLIQTENNPEIKANAMCGSYLTFVSGRTGNELDAAFGKGNESLFKNMGQALVMYSRFNGETNEYSELPKCNTLSDINLNPSAIDEISDSAVLASLFQKSTYASDVLNSLIITGNNPIQSVWGKNSQLIVEKSGNYKILVITNKIADETFSIKNNNVIIYTVTPGTRGGSNGGTGYEISTNQYLKQGDVISLNISRDAIIMLCVGNSVTTIDDITPNAGGYIYKRIVSGYTTYRMGNTTPVVKSYTFTKAGSYKLIGIITAIYYASGGNATDRYVKLYNSSGSLKLDLTNKAIFNPYYTTDATLTSVNVEVSAGDYITFSTDGDIGNTTSQGGFDIWIALDTKREII